MIAQIRPFVKRKKEICTKKFLCENVRPQKNKKTPKHMTMCFGTAGVKGEVTSPLRFSVFIA
jgi:hypothetical protein